MTELHAVGQPTKMVDGQAKVTGAVRYVADLPLPGLLYARLVTSLYAHATLKRIDKTKALATPGVVAVLTAADMPQIAPASRGRLLLARDRLLFAGQPVALVLATSEAAAEDGAQNFIYESEPLPTAITLDEALAEGAPLVWPEGVPSSNANDTGAHGADVGSAKHEQKTRSNIAADTEYTRGDAAAAFAEADVVVEGTFDTPIVHQGAIETQSTLAEPNLITGGITLYASTQAPFDVRQAVADTLGIPESLVRVVTVPVGGGFGAKNGLYEPLVAAAALAVGKPVRLVLTRMEEMRTGVPAPAMRIEARLGAKSDGTFTALWARVYLDNGCFPFELAGFATYMLGSFYRVANIDLQGFDVLTFKPSAGPYRAPSAPTVIFALDTLIDELAQRLKMDPLELRLRNASRPGDPMANGDPWPGQGFAQVLEALRQHPAWQNRAAARAQGRGVGIAAGGWLGGTEPAAAVCALNRDGMLQVNVGAVDLAGVATSFGMMAADAFGVPPDKVRVVMGDTENAPYSGGASGSKTLYTAGAAVLIAAAEARRQVLSIAADELEAAAEDLEIVDGTVRVRGYPNKSIKLGDLAGKAMRFGGHYAPVFGSGRVAQDKSAPGFNAQLVELSVDRETGEVIVHRLVVIQDVGKAINPLIVEGQMRGGALQGLGWALYEDMQYDTEGQPITGSLADYALPGIDQSPPLFETQIVEVASDHGPMGARGVGEPPIVPTAAAVANAIFDATGVRLRELPMTAPRVMAALQVNGK
jgi:CO/xanthine dehydrogenase Mo-binding subunit